VSASSRAPPTEEQVQEDLARLDAYRNQLNAMVQQHQYLSASRGDHLRAKESLEGLDRVGDSSELLIPIGGETFVRGQATPGQKILIGIGSGIVVELERPKVIELLADRLGKIDQATQELEGQIRSLDERVQLLAQRIDSVAQGSGASGRPGGASDDVGVN
jgi:prefoldin alpha subunit